MRRFSQRSHLITLSEINITPLLDLAFVLLIIFIITTPFMESGVNLSLPEGGKPDHTLSPADVRTVDVTEHGEYFYKGRPSNLVQIERELVHDSQSNSNLIVNLRTDRRTPVDPVFKVVDLCANHGIAVSWRAQPRRQP